MNSILLAFLLCAFAGIATGIGSLIASLIKNLKMAYLTFGLGLSAGVMIYISFVEMLPHAFETIGELRGVLSFFGGMLLMLLIDFLIPEEKNPHHFEEIEEQIENQKNREGELPQNQKESKIKETNHQLKRTGILAMTAIAIHNFPEGIATFMATLDNIEWGLMITIAVALHNIPEGISVTLPIIYATNDRKKGFLYGFCSGLGEPLGALIGYALLGPYLSDNLLSAIMGIVAGIMVFISVDEIIPSAHTYNEGHIAIGGVLIGMIIMAITLIVL